MAKILLFVAVYFIATLASFSNDEFNKMADSLKYYYEADEFDNYIRLSEMLIEKDFGEVDSIQKKKMEIIYRLADILGNSKPSNEAILIIKKYYDFMERNLEYSPTDFVAYLGMLSTRYYASSSIDSATFYTDIAEDVLPKVDSNSIKLLNYYNLIGIMLQNQGKLNKALVNFLKCLEVLKAHNQENTANYIVLLNNIASLYQQINNFAEAQGYYEKVLKYINDDFNKMSINNIIGIYSNIVLFYRESEKFQKAIDLIYDLKPMIKEDKELYFENLIELLEFAFLLHQDGDEQTADYFFNKVNDNAKISYSKNKNNVIFLPKYYLLKNNYYLIKNDYEQADKFINEAIKIAPKVYATTPIKLAITYFQAATYFHRTENFSEAENYYFKSRDIFSLDTANFKDELNSININLGELYLRTGMLEPAEKYLYKAVHFFLTDKTKESKLASVLNHLGILKKKSGDFNASKEYYLKSLKIQEELLADGLIVELDAIYSNLASLFLELNDLDNAEIYFKKAINFAETKNYNSMNYAKYLSNYSYMLCKNSDFDSGKHFLEKSIEIIKDKYGDNNYSLGNKYNDMALLYSQINNIDSAIYFYEKALNIYKNHLKYFTKNLNESERFEFYKKYKNLHNSYLLLLVNYQNSIKNSSHLISNLVIKNQSVLFKVSDKIKSKISSSSDTTLKAEFSKLQKIRNQIAKYYKFNSNNPENAKIDSLVELSDKLEKDLNKKLNLNFDETESLSWENISKNLKPTKIFVQISKINGVTDYSKNYITKYFAIVITPDINASPKIIEISENDDFEKEILNLMHTINDNKNLNPNLKQNTDNIQKKLYDMLFKKIDASIKDTKDIIMVLDGIYHQININTLINSSTNQYLLDENDFTFTNEFISNKSAKIQNATNEIALFGNAYFENIKKHNATEELSLNENSLNSFAINPIDTLSRNISLTSLPNTKIEIDEIRDYISSKNWNILYYEGKDASENNLKNIQSPTILHIATHSYFIKDKEAKFMDENEMINNDFFTSPLFRSFLILSKDDSSDVQDKTDMNFNDGYFTAYEAMNLDLENTELVVLSACESGLGVIQNGEGVYGLQRAFFYAGAKNIIMSLWNVMDKPTREFMVKFYELYLSGSDINKAFKETQQYMKTIYPDPLIWGSFVLING